MDVPRPRFVDLLVYGVAYPAVVLGAAWGLASSPRTFNDYALLVGVVSVAGALFLLAIRGGTRPYTHDWSASTPSDRLPAPLRSLVFLVMMTVYAVLAIAVV